MFETRADGLYYGKTRLTFDPIEVVGDRVKIPEKRPYIQRPRCWFKRPKADNAIRFLQGHYIGINYAHRALLVQYFAAA
jgi:hypothetical protein